MYKKMIQEAQAKGLASEKTMWQSVESVDILLARVKDENPALYWEFIRHEHGIIFNGHYGEEFAEYDVFNLYYKDKEGKEHHGAHWSKEEIKSATASLTFPTGTTECDKYVAFNVMYSDICKHADDGEVLKIGYAFFFDDDDYDYKKGAKIWHYMLAVK